MNATWSIGTSANQTATRSPGPTPKDASEAATTDDERSTCDQVTAPDGVRYAGSSGRSEACPTTASAIVPSAHHPSAR